MHSPGAYTGRSHYHNNMNIKKSDLKRFPGLNCQLPDTHPNG